MVNTCVVFGCNFSYSRRKIQGKEHVSLHVIPKNKDIRDAWVKAIRRKNWSPTNASAVCSQHFCKEDMDLTGQTRRLREGAVPSLFPWSSSGNQKTITATKLPVCQGDVNETLEVSCNSSSCDQPDLADLSASRMKLKEELEEENILFPSYQSHHQKMVTSMKLPACQGAGEETVKVSYNSSPSSCREPDIADLSPRERKLIEQLRKKNIELMRAKRKIKVLQQKVRRKENRIQMDRKVINELLNNEIINEYRTVLCSDTNDSVCSKQI